jgi:HSP20 family protein
MPELILWKNREMNKLRRDIDRLFCRLCDDFQVPQSPIGIGEAPLFDLTESENTLTLSAELPGMDPEGLDISITDNILTIKGEMSHQRTEVDGAYYREEKSSSFFTRSFQLPCKVRMDDIKASFEKDLLQIVMPKCSPEETPSVKIKVK